jgi:hypothetical protein
METGLNFLRLKLQEGKLDYLPQSRTEIQNAVVTGIKHFAFYKQFSQIS